MRAPIKALQHRLRACAEQATKQWFENYLKGAIRYYGVKTPQVKRLTLQWYKEFALGELPAKEQVMLCKELMRQPHAEEKFAAIFYLQHLSKHLSSVVVLDTSEWFFAQQCIFDWSTADWFTVRILAPLVKQEQYARMRISGWVEAENLWQRRASIVALRALVGQAEHSDLIAITIAKLVGERARFIQTGIGWTLSDLAKHFPQRAAAIVERHFASLAREVIDRHTKYLPQHQQYRARKRAQQDRSSAKPQKI